MRLQTVTAPPEMRPASAEMEQKVILHGVSWDTYQRLLAEHQESSGTHFAYDRGMLEIMVLSAKQELFKHTLALLVDVLAEELGITHPSLNKFPILAAVGVGEVWRYNGTRVAIFTLEAGRYSERPHSVALPGITGAALTGFIATNQQMKRTAWLRRVREWVRAQG